MYLNGQLLSPEEAKPYSNGAFINGDAVSVSFFFIQEKIYLAEDVYFFLMSSMRKMRMNIPLSFTLEFFVETFTMAISEQKINSGRINFIVFRNREDIFSSKAPVHYFYEIEEEPNLFSINQEIEMDLIKEIFVNTNLLSNIRTHCPENIYAEIYAKENDLDDLLLLNSNKRIARGIYGNLLFLEGNVIKIPKQSEGVYISPLMESFVTFVHRQKLADIEQAEIIAFESQKAEEILMISDTKGIHSVSKIRNKTFPNTRFSSMVEQWRAMLLH
ncbi:aminotransferase class IV [Riemerella columbipharyngis]|uniref:Branched-chain amino acid aminotransferase n=1 Tax=Riemerella columbipharyngis TaxID=1071918 RepID=A0A1G6ZJJ5_9FLAO|nr:aminotransferase class IV [Riemerella columbipharyngis]SDE01975.1 branched-chain amino acid aminotransferase [Riemerella columbipharyngis]